MPGVDGLRQAATAADGDDGGEQHDQPRALSPPANRRRCRQPGRRPRRRGERPTGGAARAQRRGLPEADQGADVLEAQGATGATLRAAVTAARKLRQVQLQCARARCNINVIRTGRRWRTAEIVSKEVCSQTEADDRPNPATAIWTAKLDDWRWAVAQLIVLVLVSAVTARMATVMSSTVVQAATTQRPAKEPPLEARAGVVVSDTAAGLGGPGRGTPLASVSRDERKMEAYDCSEPYGVKAISLLHDVDIRTCEERRLREVQDTQKYLLLQKAARSQIRVKSCIVKNSRLVWVCGSASHSAFSNRESYFYRMWHLTQEECERAWNEQEYRLYKFETSFQDIREVKLNTRNYMTFERTGWTKNGGTDVLCGGGVLPTYEMLTYFNDISGSDRSLHSAVVTDYVEMQLYEYDAFIATDPETLESRVAIPQLGVELAHCDPYNTTSCVSADGTFIWDEVKPQDICDYYKLREVTGINLPSVDREGEPVSDTFVSDGKDAMVRLRRAGKPIPACGSIIQPTEFPELFLTQEFQHSDFNRTIPPSEVSPFLHATMSDRYIYHRMQDNLAAAVLGLQRDQCERERRRALSAYATLLAKQKVVTDGDTAHLGDGLYITSSGEAGFLYHCRRVVVEALPFSKTCYSALPVKLQDKDEKHLRRILVGEGGDPSQVRLPPLFREPKSGRITTVATPMACTPQFPPLYRNLNGNWLKMTHVGLHQAPEPGNPRENLDESYFTVAKDKLPAPGKSSVYSNTTIYHTMWFLAASNLRELGAPKLGSQPVRGAGGRAESSPTLGSMLPQVDSAMPDLRMPSLWDALGLQDLRVALAWWGEWSTFCNGFIGGYLLYRAVCYLLNVYNALFHPQDPEDGVCLRLFEGFLPSLASAVLRGYLQPGRTKGPCYGCAAACLTIRARRQKRYEVERHALAHERRAGPVGDPTYFRASSESELPLYPRVTPVAGAPPGFSTSDAAPPSAPQATHHIPPLRLSVRAGGGIATRPAINAHMVSFADGKHLIINEPSTPAIGASGVEPLLPEEVHYAEPRKLATLPRVRGPPRPRGRGLRRCQTPLPPLTPPGGLQRSRSPHVVRSNSSDFEDTDR